MYGVVQDEISQGRDAELKNDKKVPKTFKHAFWVVSD